MSKELTREELFKKAKSMRKQAKEEASRGSFSGEGYEGVVYTSVPSDGVKVFRILGDPLAVRSKPTDPKLSFISYILGDNSKNFRCVWPSKEEQPNWILWKIFDTVMESKWDKGEDGKFQRNYIHALSRPECFRRVSKNNSDNKFERGWYPTRYVNLNIIDRHDVEYHKENKRSKLLSKRASEISDSGNFWYDPGIPEAAYNTIWDDVVEFNGQWDLYDVALKKETESPWYRAFHCYDDRKKLEQIDPEALKVVVEGELTQEEKDYKLYDLDNLFKVTSYITIKNRLGDFIKKVDVDFKKNFSKELEELVEKEKREFEQRRKEKQEEATDQIDEKPDVEEVDEGEVKNEEVPVQTRERAKPAAKERKVEIDWNALIDGSFNGVKYLGVKDMTDEEKSMVIGIKEDGQFEYVKEWNGNKVEALKNPNSQFLAPEEFHIDPLNGDLF